MDSEAQAKERSSSAAGSSKGGLKVRLIVLLGSLLLALGLGEITLRILGVGYGNAPSVGHPVFHHWHPSDYRMRVWSSPSEYGGFDAYFNSEGMAGRAELPAPGTPSIVFLGDSFTEGLQVPEDKRFVQRVGERLGLTPVNLGCSSFTPLLSRLALEAFAPRLSPRAVVLQLFSNDIGDDVELQKHAHRDGAGRITAVPGDSTSISVRLARQSYLVRLARKTWLSVERTREMKERSGGVWKAQPWPAWFTKPIEEWYSPPELQGFERSLTELRDVCRSRGLPLYLWVVPDRGAVLRGERDWYYEYLRALAAKSGVPFIDVAPALPRERVRELYFDLDIHLREEGHAAVSEVLARALGGVLSP